MRLRNIPATERMEIYQELMALNAPEQQKQIATDFKNMLEEWIKENNEKFLIGSAGEREYRLQEAIQRWQREYPVRHSGIQFLSARLVNRDGALSLAPNFTFYQLLKGEYASDDYVPSASDIIERFYERSKMREGAVERLVEQVILKTN